MVKNKVVANKALINVFLEAKFWFSHQGIDHVNSASILWLYT